MHLLNIDFTQILYWLLFIVILVGLMCLYIYCDSKNRYNKGVCKKCGGTLHLIEEFNDGGMVFQCDKCNQIVCCEFHVGKQKQ